MPKLSILPSPQLRLWMELSKVPQDFVLYRGTAIALQLGHRQSIDFDFFSSQTLNRNQLLKNLDFLSNAKIVQPEINTLDCYIDSVKIQFLAGLGTRQGRVDEFLVSEDNGILIASLRDLFATKLNTIQARAEIKDYLDIDAIIQSGISLAEGLGCAQAVFGVHFDPGTSLRALCSYHDGDLPELKNDIKKRLTNAVSAIDEIPNIIAKSPTI